MALDHSHGRRRSCHAVLYASPGSPKSEPGEATGLFTGYGRLTVMVAGLVLAMSPSSSWL
jgi:hypothetical protein